MTTIETKAGEVLTFDGDKWASASAVLAEIANGALDRREDGGYFYDPDPDRTHAQDVADSIGGKITHHDAPEFVEGAVY